MSAIADNIHDLGFHVMDAFLSEEHYQALGAMAKAMHDSGHFKPATIGRTHLHQRNDSIRNDEIAWLDNHSDHQAIRAYFNAIDLLSQTLNESLYLGLVDHEAHFSIYESQGFYKKHVDQFITTKNRRISCVYYLNDHWQPSFGGELNLYGKTDQHLATIAPEGNRLVCFSSDLPHEVLKTEQPRYSIAAWLKTRSILSGF